MWFYASGEAEARINDWQAQQAKAGRVFTCGKQAVGGFPFRIEVRCTECGRGLKDTQPPLAIRLKEILVVAQVWDPKLLIAEFTGPLSAAEPGQPPHVTASWTLAQASVRGTPSRAGTRLDRGRQSQARWRGAGHAAVRFQARRVSCARAVRLVAAQSGDRSRGEAQGRDRAEARALHARAARCRHSGGAARREGPLARSRCPRACANGRRRAGGWKSRARALSQGDALANRDGHAGADPARAARRRAAGDGGGVREIPAGDRRRSRGPALGLDRVAPALGAIDRAVPGPGAALAPQKQQALQAGLLALLGQPAEIEGKRGVSVPVRFTDGAASFGPIPLGQVPPAF